MSIIKSGILAATTAAGLLAGAPAHAQFVPLPRVQVQVAQPVRYTQAPRSSWGRPHRQVRWSPIYQVQAPVYQVQAPIYQVQAPVYPTARSYGDGFTYHVRGELEQLEQAVRARVAAGQLDGNALTAMESARDDIQEDLVDVSAKGYINDADRAHIEGDIQALRQKFGC